MLTAHFTLQGPLSTPSSERSFVGRTLSGGGSGGSGHGGGNGARAPLQSLAICDRGLNAMALSPDGLKAATAARDGVVRVHDLASGTLLTGWRVRRTCFMHAPLQCLYVLLIPHA